MKRRLFTVAMLPTLPALVWPVAAQELPIEGRHYVAVQTRQPTRNSLEVLEFFAYSCGHCNEFEPAVDAWQKKLPQDVLFRRIPVAFRESFVIQQKLFFAVEALGLVDQLHHKVFLAIHSERKQLDTPEKIGAFAASNGVDRNRFMEALESFGVAAKVKQASALANGYGIEGTPSIGVNGRWLTSGSLTGSNRKSLEVAEYLVGLARRGA